MVIGHYAAALIPVAHKVKAPFWLFLLCAQIPEFLWLLLATIGLEPTLPSSILDAALSNLQVDMKYSHNLVPALIQSVVTGLLILIIYRNLKLMLWCVSLVVIHVLCDYIVGYAHQVMWYESQPIGFNTYTSVPYIAVLIELVFAMSIVAYLQLKRGGDSEFPMKKIKTLYIVFAIGILVLLPTAKIPLKIWLGL
ncbi:MAG: hypothetical protein SH817_03905 [Leptospira sp.]|nr:hypothetical protein [Leptospira sp.]